jgi:thiamine biosynthesis lipoprotein
LKSAYTASNLKSADLLAAHHIHRFEHQAMATRFEIFLYHAEMKYAQQVVQAVFSEVDKLEQELSRFIENSDIARINRLANHESVTVGPDTLACLQMCKQINEQTGGSFDITIGALVDFWRGSDVPGKMGKQKWHALREMTGTQYLLLDSRNHSVQLLKSGLHIDLGGFGKGYALDRMAEILSDWGITCALLHSGYSTALAMATPAEEAGWPVSIKHPLSGKTVKNISLVHSAISGSGLKKGAHIIDPRTGKAVNKRLAAWSMASSAAIADALSTAFMIMPVKRIEKYINDHHPVSACIITREKSQIRFLGSI